MYAAARAANFSEMGDPMDRRFFLTCLLLASAGPAIAQDDVMASRFGNTSVVIDPSGGRNMIEYNPDHTFKGFITTGDKVRGTWKIDGKNLCLTWDSPPPGYPNPTCTPVDKRSVGDTWTSGPFTVSIEAGRKVDQAAATAANSDQSQ